MKSYLDEYSHQWSMLSFWPSYTHLNMEYSQPVNFSSNIPQSFDDGLPWAAIRKSYFFSTHFLLSPAFFLTDKWSKPLSSWNQMCRGGVQRRNRVLNNHRLTWRASSRSWNTCSCRRALAKACCHKSSTFSTAAVILQRFSWLRELLYQFSG